MRNPIAKTAKDVDFKTYLEHAGGLGDQQRPENVIIAYNWRGERQLLIDVPTTSHIRLSILDEHKGLITAVPGSRP